MTEPTDAEIAAGYLGYHTMAWDSKNILRRNVETPWAVEMVRDLVYDDPERCWRVIRSIAEATPSEDVLGSIGVALSSLLRESPEVIEQVERDVHLDRSLSVLLSWVMEDEYIQPDVWRRVLNLSAPEGSP